MACLQALKLEEFGVSGSDAENVCYLRDVADATRLVDVMQTATGGNAVVIGGGYIGMECAASLVINKINVSMVFPEPHCSKHIIFQTEFHISVFYTISSQRPIFPISLQWAVYSPLRLQVIMKTFISQRA